MIERPRNSSVRRRPLLAQLRRGLEPEKNARENKRCTVGTVEQRTLLEGATFERASFITRGMIAVSEYSFSIRKCYFFLFL